MHFPKELTTVAPLSKVLTLIMFISLPIIGFFLGMKYQTFLNRNTAQSMPEIMPSYQPSLIPSPTISSNSSLQATQLCKDIITTKAIIPDNIKNSSFVYRSVDKISGKEELLLKQTIGSPSQLLLSAKAISDFSFDGTKVAYMDSAPTIFIYDISSQKANSVQLHGKKGGDQFEFVGAWSPDGNYISVARPQAPPGSEDLYKVPEGYFVATISGIHFWMNNNMLIEGYYPVFSNAFRPWGGGEASGFEKKIIPSGDTTILFSPTETVDYSLITADQSNIYYSRKVVNDPKDWDSYPEKAQITFWKCNLNCSNPVQIDEKDIPNSEEKRERNKEIIESHLPNTFSKDQYSNQIGTIDYCPSDENWVLFDLRCETKNNNNRYTSTIAIVNLQDFDHTLQIIGEGRDPHWIKVTHTDGSTGSP